MHILQVTIAASNTAQPIIAANPNGTPNGIYFQFALFQNNGSSSMRLGDASVSTSKGIVVQQTGSLNSSLPLQYAGTLNEWYVVGTQGDVLDILYQE